MKVALVIRVTQMEKNKMNIINRIKIVITALLTLVAFLSFAQKTPTYVEGKVSFKTSKNVYAKFVNTNKINIGDTLFFHSKAVKLPCLIVKQKSSTSCVCEILSDCQIKKGDKVSYYLKSESPTIPKKEKVIPIKSQPKKIKEPLDQNEKEKPQYNERIKARASFSSNSNKYDIEDWNHRLNYRFSLNANHINNSKVSLESYMNYRQRLIPEGESTNYAKNTFRIYNLAVKYDIDTTLSIVLGRKVNYKASSLGAIDGLQLDKSIGKNYIGLIIGSRPDIVDYNLNINLLQYGAYVGRVTQSNKLYSQSTLGILEQRNNGFIDRRYTYFQHSSTINRKLNLFGSFEMDLYKRIGGVSTNVARLTNLFVSARYKFTRRIRLNVSYDSRKRIIHYETFKSEVEKLLEDDEARQGARIRLSLRPFKRVNTGISIGKRFQNSQHNASSNINGFVSWSRIPYIKGRLSLNYNHNESSYLKSNIWSIRHSRSMLKRKVNAGMYFRWVNYFYFSNEIKRMTKYYGLNISFRFTRKLSFSVLGELSNSSDFDNYRINTRLIQRFDRKNKNKK